MRPILLTCMLLLTVVLWPNGGAVADEAMADAAIAETSEAVAKQAPDPLHGKEIFETICSLCHRTDHETSRVGAPGLLDVLDRHDEAWIDQWVKSPEAFSKKDETARALVESNPYGLIMPTLPETQSEKNRRDIIAFLKTLRSKE